MKTKRTHLLVISGLGIAIAATSMLASARPGGHHGDHAPRIQELDLNDDGEISTAEIESATANQALAIDTDGDGLISVDEITAMQERKRQQHIANRLSKADANSDGSVSLAEFAEQHTARALRLDRDGNGVISADEMRPQRSGNRPGKP